MNLPLHMKKCTPVLAVLLFGLLTSASSAATILPNDDFEGASLGPWSQLNSGGISALSTTVAFTGTQSYQLNNAGAPDLYRGIVRDSEAAYATSFFRMYFYLDSLTQGGTPGNLTFAEIIGANGIGFAAEIGLSKDGTIYFGFNAATGNGATDPSTLSNNTYHTDTVVTLDTWHYLELHYVFDTTAGGAALYYDDDVTPIASSGFNQNTSFSASRFRLFMAESTAGGTVTANAYYDDVEVGTTQVGMLPVPEPSVGALAILGLGLFAGTRRIFRRRA